MEVVKRQDFGVLALTLTASIASAHFFNSAAGNCEDYKVNGGSVEQKKCGSNLAWGSVFAMVTAYGGAHVLKGTRHRTGTVSGQRRRDGSDGASTAEDDGDFYEIGEEFRALITPYAINNLVDGYSSIVDNPVNVTDNGEEWIQWSMNHTHRESQKTHGNVLKYHPVRVSRMFPIATRLIIS